MRSAATATAVRVSTSGLFRFPAAPLDASVSTVVQLNAQLQPELVPLWRKAEYTMCADGGANMLFYSTHSSHALSNAAREVQLTPAVIAGDMDSIEQPVLEYFRNKGTSIRQLREDQDTTDLHKCIQLAVDEMLPSQEEEQQRVQNDNGRNQSSPGWIVCVGALGGRLDHLLGALSTLHTFINAPVLLLGQQSLAYAIPAGTTEVVVDREYEGPTCGLLPLCGKATVTTSGLKWNLENDTMQFGGLVSTSNEVVASTVKVVSDMPLLWTSELRGRGAAPSANESRIT